MSELNYRHLRYFWAVAHDGNLTRTAEPSYGYFLKRGEATWPEYWNVDVPSRIHTCYTGVSSWFTKSLAGIRPDPAHPGFQSFLILCFPRVASR